VADRTYNVLFLCTANSARSIFGEAILNRTGGRRFAAWSAGSQPSGHVHPYAIELLQKLGYHVDGLRSKSWDEFAAGGAPEIDFVFTVCDEAARATCPVWPGQPMSAHWSVPDPVTVDGNEAEKRLAFAEAYRMLNNRIQAFTALPLPSLDRMSLKKKLDAIGDI
jgi:arsenate reductase